MQWFSPKNPTLVLAVILLALGAYLYFIEIPDKIAREEADLNETLILNMAPDTIQKITLRHPDEEIHVEKVGTEEWLIRRPLETPADPQEIRGIISTLADLRHERIVQEDGGNPAEFGLDNPFLEVVLETPENSQSLRIGDDAPVGSVVFLDRRSDGRVVTVQKWVQGALTRTAFDLREKTIFSFSPEKVDGIELRFPEHRIGFKKTSGGWDLTEPARSPADPEIINALLTALQNLRADSFIDPGEGFDRILKTLKKPLVEVSLREGTRIHQARFFDSPEEGKVRILRAETDPIFGAPGVILESIKPDAFHYQDKHLVFFDPNQVNRVEVQGPLENFTLSREEGVWKLDGRDEPVQAHLADRLVDQIQKLEAFESAEAGSRNRVSSGLDSPGHVLELFDRDSRPVASIRIGNEWKGMLFALGRPALGEVMINKDFLDEIPRQNELIGPSEKTPEESQPDEGEHPGSAPPENPN